MVVRVVDGAAVVNDVRGAIVEVTRRVLGVVVGGCVVTIEDGVGGSEVVVVGSVDGSLLFVVVVVVVGGTVEEIVVVKGSVVVFPKVVVVGLGVVVDTDVLDESMVVVVSDGGSVVDTVRVVVGQCW